MNKKTLIFLAVLLLAGAGSFFYVMNRGSRSNLPPDSQDKVFDPKNFTLTIEGNAVSLVNGVSEEPQTGSAAKIVTRYFGNEAKGDFNADGLEDNIFLISRDMGGTGVFYYAVAVLKIPGGFKITNAFLLGDRIAPQTTEYRDGRIIVNYADRNAGEPMTARPSVGVSRYFTVSRDELTEVVQ